MGAQLFDVGLHDLLEFLIHTFSAGHRTGLILDLNFEEKKLSARKAYRYFLKQVSF
jgi:hypothetical protein